MIKPPVTAVSLCAFALLAGCSGITKISGSGVETVSVSQLRNDGEKYAARMQGEGEGVIVKIEKGEVVPLEMRVESPLLSLQAGENQVRFERDVYLLISPGGVMVGPDGVSFAPIHKFESIKKLFGMGTGNLQIGFGVTQEEGAKMMVGVSSD